MRNCLCLMYFCCLDHEDISILQTEDMTSMTLSVLLLFDDDDDDEAEVVEVVEVTDELE